MAKKISFGTMFVLMSISYLCPAQYTRDQAKELVFNQLYVNDLNHVNIYLAFDLKSGQSRLILPDSDSISCPFNSNWVFFIDDDPTAGWAHPCHYIFVNAEDGAYVIISKRFFPKELKTDFELISSIPHLNFVPPDPNPYDLPSSTENPHLYAVLICGAEDNVFWNDVSAVYSTLTISYGFQKQHIFVHYANGPNPPNPNGNDLDGDGNSEIRFDALESTIDTIFNGLANGNTSYGVPKLTPEDVLFVFISDHGDTTLTNPDTSYICLPGNERLYPSELADYVKNINCSQMVFLMAQCFSGGFINDLMNFTGNHNPACKNRYVYTATGSRELSHQELWTHDGNAYFFEFVYYWVAAARHHYPHWLQPWRCAYPLGNFPFSSYPFTKSPHSPDFNPDSDLSKGGNNDLVIQMREAFNYADSMDSWSPHGYHSLYSVWNPLEYKDENPQSSESVSNGNGNGGFHDNVVGLNGLIGQMNTSQSVDGNRNYLIGGPFTVDLNKTLDIGQNDTIYLKSNLYVNGSINITDNLTVYGINEPYTELNGINVNGAFQLGANSNFNNCSFIVGLPTTSLSLNYATFNNSYISPWAIPEVHVNWSNFNNCGGIWTCLGNVSYENSSFLNTDLFLANYGPVNSNVATVQNCNFIGSNATASVTAVEIGFYGNYHVSGNTIHDYYNGITMNLCGKQNGELYQTIANNHISNCISSGIQLYNSSGKLLNNHIFNNAIGVRLMNASYFAVDGTSTATISWNTQNIKNNSGFQLFADRYSFPYSFHYNIIQSNSQDPWIFWDRNVGPRMDVRNNCWGNNFIPSNDLYPWGNYVGYETVWCPDSGTPAPSDPPLDVLFKNGEEAFLNGDYYYAKEIFQSIISTYPNTKEAEESLTQSIQLNNIIFRKGVLSLR